MFQRFGSYARELLGVVAFYPQGVDEKNLDWFFPIIPQRAKVFDKFCILSLAYRSEGFVKMLAPLRDYLSPKDPLSSLLLRMTKDFYFSRLTVLPNLDDPSFAETRWIMSEDVNVEHLLDILTSIDANSAEVLYFCCAFMCHIGCHKPRLLTLGPKIELLPDDHPLKLSCMLNLSKLITSIGNSSKSKQLLTHTLKLSRDRGDSRVVVQALRLLSNANQLLGFYEEGIGQVMEAINICNQLQDATIKMQCLIQLAGLFFDRGLLDAAGEIASRAIPFLKNDEQYNLCEVHTLLGRVYGFKRNPKKAIEHFMVSLAITSSRGWHSQTALVHSFLGVVLSDAGMFDDAGTHLELARSHAVNNQLESVHTIKLQAYIWFKQHRFEEAESEYLRALDAYERLGDITNASECRGFAESARQKIDHGPDLEW
jgi:tetratricopeptide (TPR) repeat protein